MPLTRAQRGVVAVTLAGAVGLLAHQHVERQRYTPVVRFAFPDGIELLVVQDTVHRRSACAEANERFVAPFRARCPTCRLLLARCERELRGLASDLAERRPVRRYQVISPGVRMAIEGPADRARALCENIAVSLVRGAHVGSAACAFPTSAGEPRRANPAAA